MRRDEVDQFVRLDSGTPVVWSWGVGDKRGLFHATEDGVLSICSRRVRVTALAIAGDEAVVDRSNDPSSCLECQRLVRRLPRQG